MTDRPTPERMSDDPETQLLIACAVNYAIGRHTYIVDTIAEYLKRHWSEFAVGHKETIARDVRRYVLSGMDGQHACDKQSWRELDKWIKDQC